MDYVKSKSRSTIQGFLVVLAALLTLSIGMVGLAGCSGGTSDEDAIRASLASELDSIKNIDDAFVNEFSESIDMSQLSVYGIDGVEFMKSYLSGFDYAIDSINVDGDSATAQITLTCKSYTGYLQALQTAVDEGTADPDALAALSNDEINQKIGEIVIGSLDGVELAATQPIQGRRNLGAGLVHLGRHRGRADDQLNAPSTRKPFEGRSIGAPFFYNAR